MPHPTASCLYLQLQIQERRYAYQYDYPADPFTGLPKIVITLRVTDSAGLTNTAATALTIYDSVPVAVPAWAPQPVVPIVGTIGTVQLDGLGSYHGNPAYHIVDWAWAVKGSTQWLHGQSVSLQVNLQPLPDPIPMSGITRTLTLRVTDELGRRNDADFNVTFNRLPSNPPVIRFDVGTGGIFIQRGEGFSLSAAQTSDPDGDWILLEAWDVNDDSVNDIVWNRTDTNGDGVVNGSDAGPSYVLQMTWSQMADYPGLQADGQHTIRLTVTDSTGTSASAGVILNIFENALIAVATVTPADGYIQTMFTFDGSQSYHLFPEQSIAYWYWDFDNDGVFDAVGQTVQHIFDSSGVFTVTLQVRDIRGRSNTDTLQVSVRDVNRPPVASPRGPYITILGSPITLSGTGSADPDAGDSIVSYQWNIASGALTLTGAAPALTAEQVNTLEVGIFPVSLTVTDSFEATHTRFTWLIILESQYPLAITVFSPVDIVVTDPDDLIISQTVNQIPGATYMETDVNGDGDIDDLVIFAEKKLGNYLILITPEPGASPTDTYTLEVSFAGDTIVLAEHVPVSEIPAWGYSVTWEEANIYVNYPPIANDDSYNMVKNTTLSIDSPGVLANDIDTDENTLTSVLVNNVKYGTLNLNPDGSFVYRPDKGYSGNDRFSYKAYDGQFYSNVATVTLTISNMRNKINTVVNLKSSANPSGVGQTVTFTAALKFYSSGGAAPTGTVTFRDGLRVIASNVPLQNNIATFSTSTLRTGMHVITAVYSGDDNFRTSLDFLIQRVKKTATSTKITSSPNPSNPGQKVTFTAKVSAENNSAVPTGIVTFRDSGKILGTASLNTSGQAVIHISSLTKGSHDITAVYGGNDYFNGSTSSVLNQKVR